MARPASSPIVVRRAAVFALGLLLMSAGCKESTSPPVPTSLLVTPQDVILDAIGATVTLTAEIRDQNDEPIEGTSVTWSSSDANIATVDSSGTVTAIANGAAQIKASAGSAQETTTVTVSQAIVRIDKTSGDGQIGIVGEPLPDSLEVLAFDRLDHPAIGQWVAFEPIAGSGAASPDSIETDAEGRAATEWTVGTDTGEDTLQVTAGTLSPVTFTAQVVMAGEPTNIEINDGDGQTGLVGFAVNIPPSVLVTDPAGSPVPNVEVTFTVTGGGGSVTGATVQTGIDGIATAGDWTMGSLAGTNTLDATASGVGSVGFTATGATAAYDVEVRFLSSMTPTQEQAFLDAADRWEVLIYGDLQDIALDVGAGTCGSNSPAVNETIDDLLIFATVEAIDGSGGTLGQAGPCIIRTSNSLTVLGRMRLDEADLNDLEANGHLGDVIVHEMGHVIGLGTLWDELGLLADGGTSEPHFTGTRATEAFDRLGGEGYTGKKVPVENDGNAGTQDAHWEEDVLDTELLTGFLNQGQVNPLSELTVASFWDMAYLVNLDGADAFSISVALRADAGAGTVRLTNDILNLPIYVVDRSGRVVDVIPPR